MTKDLKKEQRNRDFVRGYTTAITINKGKRQFERMLRYDTFRREFNKRIKLCKLSQKKADLEMFIKHIDYCIHYSQFNSIGKMCPMIEVDEIKALLSENLCNKAVIQKDITKPKEAEE